MLLLYPLSCMELALRCPIYIPLCFYFILAGCWPHLLLHLFTFHYASTLSSQFRHCLLQILYLHSTMLLLYHVCIILSFHSGRIYIPLCFYFISTCNYAFISGFYIYIPLCFYFITQSVKGRCTQISFTFHYASTLSCTPPSTCMISS